MLHRPDLALVSFCIVGGYDPERSEIKGKRVGLGGHCLRYSSAYLLAAQRSVQCGISSNNAFVEIIPGAHCQTSDYALLMDIYTY